MKALPGARPEDPRHSRQEFVHLRGHDRRKPISVALIVNGAQFFACRCKPFPESGGTLIEGKLSRNLGLLSRRLILSKEATQKRHGPDFSGVDRHKATLQ